MAKYRYPVIGLILALLLTLATGTYAWSTWLENIDKVEVLTLTSEELDWQNAEAACAQAPGGWQLPSVMQLVGLFYFNPETRWVVSTDYWSNTLISDRGFGLNTSLGILSFDVLKDEDHFICVRERPPESRDLAAI